MDELDIQQVKEKLLRLSAKTSFQIKKMSAQNARIELEKYEQKLINETADKIKGVIFDGVSNGLSYLEVIDEEDKKRLEEELKTNCYLEEEVINISKSIAPWIPYIDLTLAGILIGKYACTRYLRHRQAQKANEASAESSPNKSKENGTDYSTSGRVKDPIERGVEPEK